jgi:hypothetical protein
MKRYIWVFILTVAAADVYFSWSCRASIFEWEANPVASLACRQAGIGGAIALRAITLGYAALMARLRSRCGWLITPIGGIAHLYLLAVLARSYQHLGVLGQ